MGSTILVLDEDRPELEEGDFYARDLVGMRVTLQVFDYNYLMSIFNSGKWNDFFNIFLSFHFRKLVNQWELL